MRRRATIFRIYALELKQSLSLGLPIMVGQLGYIVVQITDNLMVGQIGKVPLAASAFVSSIFSFFLVFGVSTLNFTSTTVSKYFGAQQYRDCGEAWRVSLGLAVLISLAIISALLCLYPFLNFFGQPLEVVEESKSYFLFICFSILPLCLFHSTKQFCESIGHSWIPFWVQAFTILGNIFFNWVFIFGKLGSPAFGLAGAGISTLLVRTMAAVALSIIVFRKPIFKTYFPESWKKSLNRNLVSRSIRLGIPAGLQGIFEVGLFAVAAIMMGWIGTTALAAHQITIGLAAATFMFVMGLSFAANIRVSHALGRNNLRAARRIGVGIFCFAGFFMAVMGILLFFFRFNLPALFVQNEPDVIALAGQLLIVAAVFQIFDGLQVSAVGALRGLEDVRIPTYITFSCYWLIGLPLCSYLGFKTSLGATGIWIGLATCLFLAACILCTRFVLLTRKTSRTLLPS